MEVKIALTPDRSLSLLDAWFKVAQIAEGENKKKMKAKGQKMAARLGKRPLQEKHLEKSTLPTLPKAIVQEQIRTL